MYIVSKIANHSLDFITIVHTSSIVGQVHDIIYNMYVCMYMHVNMHCNTNCCYVGCAPFKHTNSGVTVISLSAVTESTCRSNAPLSSGLGDFRGVHLFLFFTCFS